MKLRNGVLVVNNPIPQGFRFQIISLSKVKVPDSNGKEVAGKDLPRVLKKGVTVEITRTGNRVRKIQVKKVNQRINRGAIGNSKGCDA